MAKIENSRLAVEVRPQIAPASLTLAQLEALGLSARAVRHRVAAGRLHRLHRGVLRGRTTERARTLDGRRAGVWQGGTGRVRTRIDVHSGAQIARSDIALHQGIPCTSVARTLLDLGGVVGGQELERALDRAEELRRFDRKALVEVLDRCPRRRGARALRAVLDGYAGPAATRSVAEERFLAAIQGAGLPLPEVNRWISLDGSSGYRPGFPLAGCVDPARVISELRAFLGL